MKSMFHPDNYPHFDSCMKANVHYREGFEDGFRAGLEAAAKVCGDSGDYYIERAEGWLLGYGIPRVLAEEKP